MWYEKDQDGWYEENHQGERFWLKEFGDRVVMVCPNDYDWTGAFIVPWTIKEWKKGDYTDELTPDMECCLIDGQIGEWLNEEETLLDWNVIFKPSLYTFSPEEQEDIRGKWSKISEFPNQEGQYIMTCEGRVY